MEDEWGIFDDVDATILSPKSVGKSMTGGKISNLHDLLRGVSTTADDNTVVGNLLKDYDRLVLTPVIKLLLRWFYSTILKHVCNECNVHSSSYWTLNFEFHCQ